MKMATGWREIQPRPAGAIEGWPTWATRSVSGRRDCATPAERGSKKDPVEALKWYRKVADQGYAYADFAVGQMYQNGLGVAKDDIEALAWYNLAPNSGGSDKTNHRDRLERALGPEAAQQARRRADELRKEIQAGNPPPAN